MTMGLISRLMTTLKSKLSRIADTYENPAETLDYSYERQLELLQNVKRGIVEVTTSRRRVELQATRLQDGVARLNDQARAALAAGREDLARLALQRKQVALQQLDELDGQLSELEKDQQRLTATEQRLASQIEAFRTRKEVIKAQYSAAEAQVRIGEATTGLSEEMAEIGLAVQRAEEKTERMRARAGAIDELVQSGTLEDLTMGRRDVLDRELGQIAVSSNVEHELAE
jgi:phage shock protein A